MSIMKKQKICSVVLGTYLLCYIFRILEYFVLRTDQTWVGEAIVHKIIGILILLAVSAGVKLTIAQIGFVKEKALCNLLKGLAFGLVVTSTLVGFKLAMLTQMTGSLYMAMGDHFVNNTIVNLLHVVSDTGADEMMVVRVAIAQSVSFILVLVCYICGHRKKV